MEKKKWGGKREGCGRKKLDNVAFNARMNVKALSNLKKRAKAANLSIGLYIEKELNL